ncbi:polysaccharide deacetylase family protein [Salibacterium aidingense]|uniref:polysaccharide deacetylase family protein n=1 Tax=Salibacterium aidingense TaxID=384933 RepID=UPI003BD337EF
MRRIIAAIGMSLLLSACGLNAEETASKAEEAVDTESAEKTEAPEESDTPQENEEEPGDEQEDTSNKKEVETEDKLYEVNKNDSSLDALKEGMDEQKVLITIDDAPDAHSVEMAEFLSKQSIPAIFFVNGHFLQSEEGRKDLKKIADMGFEIGNHTMNHVDVSELSRQELEEEIGELNDIIEKITGEPPSFFRAPFGINSDASKAFLEEEEMTWMNWTYGYDWEAEYQNAEDLADIMVHTELLRSGANLLMHDREWTKEALPDIVDGFKEKGYGFIDPDHIVQNNH